MVEPYNKMRTPTPVSTAEPARPLITLGVIASTILVLVVIWAKTTDETATGERRNGLFNAVAGVLGIREYIPSNVANTLGIQGGAARSGTDSRGVDPAFGGAAGQGQQRRGSNSYSEARLDVTDLTEFNTGFGVSTLHVEITNIGSSGQRNPVLRCWQLGQNGTSINQEDTTIYQDAMPGETISARLDFFRNNQTANIQCQVVSASGL
jgi:hypothetical protein